MMLHALAWVHADNLVHLTENNISMLRMAHKVTLLLVLISSRAKTDYYQPEFVYTYGWDDYPL